MKILTVVVTCSSRKSLASDQALQVRNLPAADVALRSELWRAELAHSDRATRSLDRLYQGEAWGVANRLRGAAGRAGFHPRLLVASAGLGLRDVSSLAPGYDATFATGHEDAVGNDRDERRAWWRNLRAGPGALEPAEHLQGAVMLVLSSGYADALHEDVVTLGARGGDTLLVGGKVEVPGVVRLRADRGLRSALGGTTSSLNVRMALNWLERLPRPALTDSAAFAGWHAWAESVRLTERWDRGRMTDEEVVEYLEELRGSSSRISVTSALRALRAAGYACEQRRFTNLFVASQLERSAS